MNCRQLDPMFAGWLYGELSPEEEKAVREHLEACRDCRERAEHLRSVRRLLGEVRPIPPDAPRILLLRPAPWTPWAAAAALLGAAILGATLANFAGRIAREPQREMPGIRAPEPRAAVAAGPPPAGPASPPEQRLDSPTGRPLTEQDLERRLAELERKLRRQRERELQAVFAEIAGVEMRTADSLARTQEALRFVALANSPGVSEQ
jgi:hypothetical protein